MPPPGADLAHELVVGVVLGRAPCCAQVGLVRTSGADPWIPGRGSDEVRSLERWFLGFKTGYQIVRTHTLHSVRICERGPRIQPLAILKPYTAMPLHTASSEVRFAYRSIPFWQTPNILHVYRYTVPQKTSFTVKPQTFNSRTLCEL